MARSRLGQHNALPYVFYLLFVLLAPLLVFRTGVHAEVEEAQKPIKDSQVTGPIIGIDLGTTYSYVLQHFSHHR